MGFSSCSLDENDPTSVTADVVYSTEDGYKGLIISCYYNLTKSLFCNEDYIVATEGGTDLWTTLYNRSYAPEFFYYNNLTSSANYAKKIWKAAYTPINLCNSAIERANKVVVKSTDYNVDELVAEAYFLRAYYYSIIVEQYGNVVLELEETNGVNLTPNRSSVEDIYKSIISDLKFAVEHLPLEQDVDGRVTQKAAKGWLAKVYLQGAAYGFSEGGKSFEQLAKETAEYFIEHKDLYGAALYDDYNDIWLGVNNKKNKEALFVASCADWTDGWNTELMNANPNGAKQNTVFRLFTPKLKTASDFGLKEKSDLYGRSSELFMPTKAGLELFADEDKRCEGSFVWSFLAENTVTLSEAALTLYNKNASLAGQIINKGDVGLVISKKKQEESVKANSKYLYLDLDDIYNEDGTPVVDENYSSLCPYLKKFRPTDVSGLLNGQQYCYIDMFVMRFAEVYLIAAEANVMLGETDKAAEYVNVLRERVSNPEDFVMGKMKVQAADMTIDFILDERARELYGEYNRWYDLKRTKKFEERLGAGKMNPSITLFDASRHYLRPISEDFLNEIENATGFGNNPGY